MATVIITEDAQEQFYTLPAAMQTRVQKLFVRLEQWPAVSGTKALSGNLAGPYRIHTGDYRVQFRVARGETIDTVIIEKVGHRDRFYED